MRLELAVAVAPPVAGVGLSPDVGIGIGFVSGGLTGESGVPPNAGELPTERKAPLAVGAGLGLATAVGAGVGAAAAPGEEKVPADVRLGAVGLVEESHAAANTHKPITNTMFLRCMPPSEQHGYH